MYGCLIIPPSPFLLDERVFPSLGILKVAAVLEAVGQKVRVLDLSGVTDCVAAIQQDMLDYQAAWYGLTITTPQLPAAALLTRAIRQRVPHTKIILGGAHVTLTNAAARRERTAGKLSRASKALEDLQGLADVLVAGDGEQAIFQALQAPHGSVIDADQPNSVLFLTPKVLETSPMPARHLIDMKSYHAWIDGVPATSIVGQLGCPFGCSFCGGRLSPTFRRVRLRPTRDVICEIEHLIETYGTRGIMFQDDELNVNPAMLELMAELEILGHKQGALSLRGFIKSQLFTDEQAVAMQRAGFREILVGFESGDDRILKNINKKATREDNTRCVQIAKRHGLRVKALMSIGQAGESEATIAATRDWLLEVEPEEFDITVITVYPGTPYYDDAVQTASNVWTYTAPSGDKLHAINIDYRETAGYYKGVPGSYKAYVYTDTLTTVELARLRDATEREVREKLGIPYPKKYLPYEHSMGQA
jgi:radical SAM superfamily enzyme YgiQ (UPF0313 family)